MSKQTDTRNTKSEVTKIKYSVIGLSAVFGLAIWFIDAALDRFFFYEGTFWELLITDVPKLEIYIRSVFLVCVFVFGILVAEVIARRKRAEQQLRAANQQLLASEQQLKAANRQLGASQKKIMALAKFPGENPNPVLRITKDGEVLYSNEAGKPLLAKWKSDVGEAVPEKWQKLIVSVFKSQECKTEKEEVEGKIYSLDIAPVKNVGYVNLYARDITERKKAENDARKHREEFLHVSRLSTVGEMASGLAHELNQPLCAILTHGNVCLRNCENDIKDIDKFKENLKIITSQSKRAGEIVNRIKDFVQKRAPQRKKNNINDIIHETVNFLGPLIQKNNIRLDLQLNAQRPFVLADPIQIEQVLINLACNAIESMQKVNTRKHRLILQTSIHSNNLLEIAISDTGEGLSQDIEKLSEPFFTTKKDGLGIGLSISHSIVEAHGGTLCAETNPDYGCTFKVTLPVGNVNDKTIACE